MADKFFTGSTVSRYLPPQDRAWSGIGFQSGKPVLDSELNLEQDITINIQRLLSDRTAPSGWLKGQNRLDSYSDFSFDAPTAPGFVPDSFHMRARTALIAGMPVRVEFANIATAGDNLIVLDTAPVLGGPAPDVKRTDFVWIEVWQAMVSDSANASATVTIDPALPADGDIVTINGVPLTAKAVPPGVDEFLIGADEFATASNMASAINNIANSFSTFVTASSGGSDVVTLRAVASGAAGNLLTLASTAPGELIISGPTFTGGVDEPNKPDQDSIYRHGNVQSPSATWLDDDIADPAIGQESTKRIQVQYRIRHTGQAQAVNHKTQPDGFSNTLVLAQGAQTSPVAGYRFVKADKISTAGSSSAVAYGIEDCGLWIAGDGTLASANALGTIDGFVYAIPLCMVFRRNDAYVGGTGIGWDPINNTNGGLPSSHAAFANPAVGVIGVGESDRPDGKFTDVIYAGDLLDLRRHVALPGHDFYSELNWQMQSLLDGKNATWAIDAADKQTLGAGSGDVSTTFLVCNQIGRDTAHGGNPPISGDTTRGTTIRNFDHVSRRFADYPVVERVVFEFIPSYDQLNYPGKYVVQANGGYVGWADGDELHLDLSQINATTIGTWDPLTQTYTGFLGNASISDFTPPGTTITDILVSYYDDGHYTNAVDQSLQIKTTTGIGTDHIVVTLDGNDRVVNGGNPGNADYRMVGDGGADDGSPRRIFLEIELTYPLGQGITDTADVQVIPDPNPFPRGPILENNTTQRPDDWEDLLPARFRPGYREVAIEYVANEPGTGVGSGTPITDNFVSASPSSIRFLRRIFGSTARQIGVTDAVTTQTHDDDESLSEYGSSSRLLKLDTGGPGPTKLPLSGTGQTEVNVTYFAQDALPNYGASGGGYQVGVYFRTTAPQTVGVQSGVMSVLPDPLVVEPLVMAQWVWTGTTGKGSVDLPFPYLSPMDPIPVNDGGTSTFPGEWYFSATAQISIDDFDGETGLLNVHTVVPVDETGQFEFSGKSKDVEFRAYYAVSDPTAYRPTAFAQSLSNVARHKVWLPFLARAVVDSSLWRKNEVLLVVITRWAELDSENTIRFTDVDNRTCAAIYRTRNLLMTVGE